MSLKNIYLEENNICDDDGKKDKGKLNKYKHKDKWHDNERVISTE